MPKIKMGDIKSGSENVKKVFRKNMPARTDRFLKSLKFSNDEMIEILYLADDKEYHRDCREFLQRLVLSQTGPFNSKMFDKFVDKLFHYESLVHLLEHATGLSDDAKKKFINYSLVSSPYKFIPNFYKNGECNKFGINVKTSPMNMTYAVSHTKFADSSSGKTHDVKEFNEFIFEILDTLTESEIFEWYETELQGKSFKYKYIAQYKNCPKDLLLKVFEGCITSTCKSELAAHPNCPSEIKVQMYEETGDEKYLPQEVQDIFVF